MNSEKIFLGSGFKIKICLFNKIDIQVNTLINICNVIENSSHLYAKSVCEKEYQ